MSRKLSHFLRSSVIFSLGFFALFAEAGRAQDALHYFKNYFVTGDYVVGGIGLRGKGLTYAAGHANPQNNPKMIGSFATGTITIGGADPNGSGPIPVTNGVPADIIAAFLYWQTDEPSSFMKPQASIGFFDGNEIAGAVLGSPQNPACDGTSSAFYGRSYRADVLRYLKIDPANNVRIANGPHIISLRDSGAGGAGPFTNGASLVIVYRILVPGNPTIAPLSAVVIYDGSFSISKNSGKLDQTIGGFYQSYQNSGNSVQSKLTPIAGNGQPDFNSTLNITDSIGPGLFKKSFIGSAGTRWDNPTFSFNMKANDDGYALHVTFSAGVCLTFSSFVTSTRVVDTDNDGLLDVWETKGLHLNIGDATHPATFGGCADYPAERCVNLPKMGASPTKPDVFMEIDWLHGKLTDDPAGGHLHIPKIGALNAVGDTFANHGIATHFDVGNNYQGNTYQNNTRPSPYIIKTAGLPGGSLQGGEVLEESELLCSKINDKIMSNVLPTSLLGKALAAHPLSCEFNESYAVLSYKRGFLSVKNGFPLANMVPHFDEMRKDIFRYNLFGHALATFNADGTPTTDNGQSNGVPTPLSISGVADRPGADLMITLGLWRFDDVPGCDPTGSTAAPECADQTGTTLVQAGTLLHEFGHNLGLSHAGLARTPNCVPDYPSQMNYLYQVKGLTDAQGLEHIDFSNGTLKPVDEWSLSKDPASLGPLTYRVRFYSPSLPSGEGFSTRHCDGSLITDGAREIRLETSTVTVPDWDRSGTLTPARIDVNFDGVTPTQSGMDVFHDSNDWAHLNLQQIGARLNTDGLSVNVGSLDIGSLDIGSLDIGSLDIGSLDIGSLDIGSLDIGSLDIGSLDIGSLDIGSLDIGSLDIGSLDIGEMNFDDATSSLDPTNAAQPLKVQNTATSNVLTWGAPTIGLIRHYNVYRVNTQDPAHQPPVAIYPLQSGYSIDGAPPTTTYTDTVNDYAHAGPACPTYKTCFNTTYRYYITAIDINKTESSASNAVTSEVTHLFVIANDQSAVYGDNFPDLAQQVKIFGDVAGSLSPANVVCKYTIQSTDRHNVGTYSVITCPPPPQNPAQTSPTDGITYLAPDATYNDGTVHTQGRLTITGRHISVTAQHNEKVYDSTTTAVTQPKITTGNLVFTQLNPPDTANFSETYDNKKVGAYKTLTPSGFVNDTNDGQNYVVDQFIKDTTGVITPAPLTITAVTNTKTFDRTTSAAETPTFSGLQVGDTVTGLAETYDTPAAGTGKTLTVSSYTVNDGNGGNNYRVTTTANTTGVITLEIGKTAPAAVNPPAGQNCFNCTLFQSTTVTGSPSYSAPSAGTILSWSVQGPTDSCPGCTAKLRIFRPTRTGQYQTVAETIRQNIVTGLNTFPVNIAVQAGDLLGVDFTNGIRWFAGQTGDTIYDIEGDPAPPSSVGSCRATQPPCWFTDASTNNSLANVSAQFAPSGR